MNIDDIEDPYSYVLIDDAKGWKSLDFAPKDKTVIVAFDEPFFGKVSKETAYGYYDSVENEWFFDNTYTSNVPKRLLRPTHWMDKPEPPSTES